MANTWGYTKEKKNKTMKISTRIQYELNKYDLTPTEIILGTWIFNEFVKEREIEEMKSFEYCDKFEYLGIKVTKSNIIDPSEIQIYRSDKIGIYKFFHSFLDLGEAALQATTIFSKWTSISIVTSRYADEEDYNQNYLLLQNIPKKQYKPFLKMIKAGFDIKSALKTLNEIY